MLKFNFYVDMTIPAKTAIREATERAIEPHKNKVTNKN